MKLKSVVYLDSSIKVCFVKTGRKEITQISPDLVQYLIISYGIGLINNPGTQVKETIKIDIADILFTNQYLVLSIPLEGLENPQGCKLTISFLTFYLTNKPKYKIQIGETISFRNIKSDTSIIDDILKKADKAIDSEKIKKTMNVKNKKPTILVTQKPNNYKIEDVKHFITSYEKFKSQVKDSVIQELLEKKSGTIDFNLKKFGISLLCKLMLLTKYVNELVDNEFQEDLQEFLKIHFIEKANKGVMT